jgi:DNA polymerase III sliding clamp (beta) subunit (PCNA family)
MHKDTLIQIIKMLENVASDDNTRFQLSNVRIERKQMIATDGYIMAISPIEDPFFINDNDTFYIHRDELPYLKLVVNGLRCSPLVPSTIIDKSINIQGRTVTNDCANYPNYKQLIPNNITHHSVSFSPQLLLDLCKGLGMGKNRSCRLDFPADNKSPIKVTVDDNTGVLMPMRM